MWGRSHERPPAHTVTTSDDLLQQQQLCLIGVSTPNRRDGSCDDLGPNPNSPTKQGSKIGHSVRGDVLCVVSLVGCHRTCEVSACPPIMDEGSYMCHNCQGSGSLAIGPSCSSMLYVAGLVTALCGGAPMVGAIPALVRVYTDADSSWSKALGVFSPARDARA